MESESFTTQTEYDALNRPTLVTQPDGSQHKPSYNEAGLLEKMEVQLQHESSFTEYVENIDYDAKGQRTDIFYGNGSKTRYFYDENTFRLTRLLTTRNTGSDVLQDLNYTYDPVGNIVEMEDDAQQTHYFSNTVIDPKSKYQYDALYRLLKATGREKDSLPMPGSGGYTPDFVNTDAQSSDTFRTYCQQFTYDDLGNIEQLSHRATCGGTEHWKRNYEYNGNKPDNYLLSTYTGATPPGTPEYTYDNHGNMLAMPHLSALNWDFADQLKSSEKTDETTHYVYSGGERVRKVVLDTSGGTDKIKYERIYLGGYELYREYDSSENLDLERETHHVSDDKRKLALLEVKTVNNGSIIADGSRTTIARYQYTNHLDSACLELNDSAEILSYEEYHPFGTTSYSLHTNDSEVSLKRYKYVHKERDDESGLYYYGARYYAAWLCRFVSVDPLKDDYPYLTDYNYSGNKPVTFIDVDGLQGEGDEPVTHTVQKGQTLSGIAQENNMTVEEIRKLNPDLPQDATKLQIGTELTLSLPRPLAFKPEKKEGQGRNKNSSEIKLPDFSLIEINDNSEGQSENSFEFSERARAVAESDALKVTGLGFSIAESSTKQLIKHGYWIGTTSKGKNVLYGPDFNGNQSVKKSNAKILQLKKSLKFGGYIVTGIAIAPDLYDYLTSEDADVRNEAEQNLKKELALIGLSLASPLAGITYTTGELIMSTDDFKEQRRQNLLRRSRDFYSSDNFSAWKTYRRRYGGRDMTKDQIRRAY